MDKKISRLTKEEFYKLSDDLKWKAYDRIMTVIENWMNGRKL
jgi:hypothetical protein